jgi:hypothetical protein
VEEVFGAARGSVPEPFGPRISGCSVGQAATESYSSYSSRCRIHLYLGFKAAPLHGTAGAPATGLCAGAPARHGRAATGQLP